MENFPLSIKEAEEFLKNHGRHYKSPAEPFCAIGVRDEDGLHGAATIGRRSDTIAELAHIYCDGASSAYTLLYGSCWRTAKALGFKEIVL